MKINVEYALLQSGKNAEKNTWERYHKVYPNIIKENGSITLKTDKEEVSVTHSIENILFIILTYTYAPVWIVKSWLNNSALKIDSNDTLDIIRSWINIGLVWCEGTVTGEYLRPTYLLFELFGQDPETYANIPYNQLTHNICEQQITYEVMTGSKNNPLNVIFKNLFIPKYSPLGIGKDKNGTNIISEKEFKPGFLYTAKSSLEIEDMESKINEEIKLGKSITDELADFSRFAIIKKNGNTGDAKKDFELHIPDLIIPIPRKRGKAMSIAVEIELSHKGKNRYKHTLEKYKNNNRFGHLVWFSVDGKINASLTEAFEEVKGLGNTQMSIFEFTVPSPSEVYKIK